ncbi:VOC family protein [Streptococcus cristatus]|uniref:VOC family protein n=1 Tax=Streptococcus cristatus TaxID=45634 RepID=UPI0028D50E9D|nr:VOC family protein [Streptococcus cristatus]
MTFEYGSKIYLGEVALYVADLASQKDFYQHVLGLELLEEQDGQVALGRVGQVLVRLLATSDRQSVKSAYGLYHLALLLPSRQALADILKHLSENKVPMVGGADHGYSEAIYLEDPEGNGIELYRDKPQADWDIREDGRIIGVTEALAAQEIYELGQEVQPFSIAEGTRMGHVHLSVKNSRTASHFYQKLLDLEDKFSVPSARWLASGNYHHHLAVNEWGGSHLNHRQPKQQGLAYFEAQVEGKEDLVAIYENALDLQAPVRWISSQELEITDPDGIVAKVKTKVV